MWRMLRLSNGSIYLALAVLAILIRCAAAAVVATAARCALASGAALMAPPLRARRSCRRRRRRRCYRHRVGEVLVDGGDGASVVPVAPSRRRSMT